MCVLIYNIKIYLVCFKIYIKKWICYMINNYFEGFLFRWNLLIILFFFLYSYIGNEFCFKNCSLWGNRKWYIIFVVFMCLWCKLLIVFIFIIFINEVYIKLNENFIFIVN